MLKFTDCFRFMNALNILGIIPARYASTRFPGKPLAKIKGVSMIERVYRQCLKADKLTHLCVATDDRRILEHVREFGGESIMTSEHHATGTDRCYEASVRFSGLHREFLPDVILNIQGDEPLIDPEVINSLAVEFYDKTTEIATASTTFSKMEDVKNPNTVKIVPDRQNNALYFSRLPIPFFRNSNSEAGQYIKHIGIYAFRPEILKQLCSLPQSQLEKAESLEQLRWLESGYSIRIVNVATEGICVDVPDDIALVENFMNKHFIP